MWQWLTKEYRPFSLPLATLALVVSYFVWCSGLFYSGIIPPEIYEGIEDIHIEVDLLFLILLFEAAMIEEMMFRAPLTFVVRRSNRPVPVILSVIGLSVVFGYLHYMTWWSVLIQGISGVHDLAPVPKVRRCAG